MENSGIEYSKTTKGTMSIFHLYNFFKDSIYDSNKTTMNTDVRSSRLSNQMQKLSFLESEMKYMYNPEDYKEVLELDEKMDKEEILNLDIRINALIKMKKEEILKTIVVKITNKITIRDLLKESVDMFNNLFYKENVPYEFKNELKLYSLKPSKKNGKPQNDFPSNYYFNNTSYLINNF